MEELSLTEPRGVFEFELNGGGRRLLMDGQQEFDPDDGPVGRVAVGADAEERGIRTMGFAKDSTLRLRLPSSELESEELYEVELRFFTGDSPVVLMSGSGMLPRESVFVLLERIERALKEADLARRRYPNLARAVKGVALTPLRQRIEGVEESVRTALDDDRFTDEDYEALQGYPLRLARVERLARLLHGSEPVCESHEPKRDFPVISAAAKRADFFFKWAEDIEREARDSTARMSGLISSQQIVLTQRQAGEAARFQRLVTVVGAAVLVPGLVAAVFGANVGFRGRESTDAFWAMLLLMAGSGLVSFALIRAMEIGLPEWLAESRPVRWSRSLGPFTRVAVAAVLGGLLALAGVVVLLSGG